MMQRLVAPLSLLLVGSLAHAELPGSKAPIAEVMAQLRKIESAAWRGRVDPVRIELESLARTRPNDPMLRVYVAWCSMPSDDAWNQLKNISQIFPDLNWVHFGMGRIYVGWKMADQARVALSLAMKSNPSFYPALVALGDLARAKGDWAEAEAKYRAALQIADDPEAHTGLGLVLLKQEKRDDALRELKAGTTLWPDQPHALKELLSLQQRSNDPAAAQTMVTLGELLPKDRDIRRMVASSKFESGDAKGAVAEYEKLLKLGNPELETTTRLQGLYRQLGEAEGEERVSLLIAGLDPESVEPLLRVAELREAKKDADGAEKALLEALGRNRSFAETFLRLGVLSLKRERPVAALEWFRFGANLSGPIAETCRGEAKKLEDSFRLPQKRAKGSVDRIYGLVAKSLDELYVGRRRANPKLSGTLKVRVKVSAEGVVEGSEVIEDTVGDSVLTGHAVYALRDAEFEKRRREPVFEFELGAALPQKNATKKKGP
jgi:tetratricopeptide (TPR) repeat protein